MATTMSDLTEDLVSEILSRVPITSLGSVRLTCKKWNALSRIRIFGKVAEAKNQFMGFMMKDLRICSVKIDLQGICNDGDDFVSIKQVAVLNQIQVFKAYHCDGLLLCFPTDHSRLLVWNPYLGQMRSIPHEIHPYDNSFALGYDDNGNHKILEILDFGYNIYEFNSNSWRFHDVRRNWEMLTDRHGVTLKGNAYFYAYAQENVVMEGAGTEIGLLICFDFTSERFGPRLSLPSHYPIDDTVILSCVRDEKLAVFIQSVATRREIIEIWVTDKINYNEVSWTKCFEVNTYLLTGFCIDFDVESFFIDEEKKVVVLFDIDRYSSQSYENRFYQKARIIGQDGYFKSITVGGAAPEDSFGIFMLPLLCSSYQISSYGMNHNVACKFGGQPESSLKLQSQVSVLHR